MPDWSHQQRTELVRPTSSWIPIRSHSVLGAFDSVQVLNQCLATLCMTLKIYNVEPIGRGALSVMAKPMGDEALPAQMRSLSTAEVNRVVCLLEPNEAALLGLAEERQIAESHGMEFINYPIKDFGLPPSVEDFLSFTRRLYDEAAQGAHMVIHCRAGIGRTGVIAAGVLLHCGYDALQALKHLSIKRGVDVPDTQEQIDWVITSAKHLKMHGYSKPD